MLLKNKHFKKITESFERKFEDFIKGIEKARQTRSEQNRVAGKLIIEKEDFFINRYFDIETYTKKIFELINESELSKLINKKDLKNIKIKSDGAYHYFIFNSYNQKILTLFFNGSIKDDFDKKKSEYKISCAIGEIDIQSWRKSKIVKLYQNQCKGIIGQEILKKNIESINILKKYADKFNFHSDFSILPAFDDIRNIDFENFNKEKNLNLNVTIDFENINYIPSQYSSESEYFFNVSNSLIAQKLEIKTLESFNILLDDIEKTNKYLKDLRLDTKGIDYSSISYKKGAGEDNKPKIFIKEQLKNKEWIRFYICPNKHKPLDNIGESEIYINKERSGFTFQDYLNNRMETIEYLRLMKY